jgi:hypothetical protein
VCGGEAAARSPGPRPPGGSAWRRYADTVRVAGAVGLAALGCAAPVRPRGEVVQQVLPSSVQISAERNGTRLRAASGVVIHSATGPDHVFVLTTRHPVQGLDSAEIYASPRGETRSRRRATVVAVSRDADLALLRVDGVVLPAAVLGEEGRLGEDVWVVAFPWGKRMTLVSGVVSQVEPSAESDGEPDRGAPLMIDASVSYGASGAGVYEAAAGRLIGLVEGVRTARMQVRGDPKLAVEFPVAGETGVVPARAIRRFLEEAGYGRLLSQ